MKLLSPFLKSRSGVTAIEYSVVMALVSAAIVLGAEASGERVNTVFTTLSTTLGGEGDGGDGGEGEGGGGDGGGEGEGGGDDDDDDEDDDDDD